MYTYHDTSFSVYLMLLALTSISNICAINLGNKLKVYLTLCRTCLTKVIFSIARSENQTTIYYLKESINYIILLPFCCIIYVMYMLTLCNTQTSSICGNSSLVRSINAMHDPSKHKFNLFHKVEQGSLSVMLKRLSQFIMHDLFL